MDRAALFLSGFALGATFGAAIVAGLVGKALKNLRRHSIS